MKPPFALLAVTLLSLGSGACGGAGEDAGSVSHAAAGVALPKIEVKGDADSDSDRYGNEPDNEKELLGRASAGDARTIAALVERYYAAAMAEDGAAACRLLYRPRAEAVPGSEGSSPAPPGLHERECAAVMSKLFKRFHKQFSAEGIRLKVISVRITLNRGAVQIGSGGMKPYHYIMVHRERGAWKIDMLFGTEQPIIME